MTKLTVLLPLAVTALLTAPAAALAQPAQADQGFGQHLSRCARTMGFSGDHNPGMHQGLSDWDGVPC